MDVHTSYIHMFITVKEFFFFLFIHKNKKRIVLMRVLISMDRYHIGPWSISIIAPYYYKVESVITQAHLREALHSVPLPYIVRYAKNSALPEEYSVGTRNGQSTYPFWTFWNSWVVDSNLNKSMKAKETNNENKAEKKRRTE